MEALNILQPNTPTNNNPNTKKNRLTNVATGFSLCVALGVEIEAGKVHVRGLSDFDVALGAVDYVDIVAEALD